MTAIDATRHRRPGPYQVQAAIAAIHSRARSAAETDWQEIDTLYGVLEKLQPSPIVTLNRAVAVSKLRGPAAALEMIEPLGEKLQGYFHYFGAKGAWLHELGRIDEARVAFDKAIALAHTPAQAAHIRQWRGGLGLRGHASTEGPPTGEQHQLWRQARGLRNGRAHGRVAERRRIRSPQPALHVGKLKTQSRDSPGGELIRDCLHGRVFHAGTRAVCQDKTRRGGRRMLEQRRDAAGLVDRQGQSLCNFRAHWSCSTRTLVPVCVTDPPSLMSAP